MKNFKGKIYCFSPEVMLLTFLFEVVSAGVAFWKYKINDTAKLLIAVLLALLLSLAVVLRLRKNVIEKQQELSRDLKPAFAAIAWEDFPESDLLAIVKLDQPSRDLRHLINQDVVIDGRPYRCVDVETRLAKGAAVCSGEQVGLRVIPAG